MIKIKRLTPDQLEDYLAFLTTGLFQTDRHSIPVIAPLST